MTQTALHGLVVPIEPVYYEAPIDEVEVQPTAPVTLAPPVFVPAARRHAPPPSQVVRTPERPAATTSPPSTATPEAERRWKTRHFVAAIVAALAAGVLIGRATGSSSTSESKAAGAASRSASPANGIGAQPSAGPAQQSTTGNGSPNTASPATTATINGHPVVFNIPRQTGSMTTQHFTVTGPRWTLGWAYDCTAAPGGSGAFNVRVMDASGGSSTDGGINQQGATGSSVVAYTSTGERYLWVTTDCVWAIRVAN